MRFLTSLATLALATFASDAYAEPFRTKHVTAELLLENTALQAGASGDSENWIGMRLEMAPHWHTYWRFPGDSGLPTEVKWELPRGWKAGPARWPLPQRIFVPPLVNYGYENSALIGFQLRVPAGESEGLHRVVGKTSWLVCKEECIPEEGELVLNVKVTKGKSAPDTHANLFSELRRQQPLPAPAGSKINIIYKGQLLGIELEGMPAGAPDFFPLAAQVVKGDAPPEAKSAGGKTTLWLEKAAPFNQKAEALPGVLIYKKENSLEAFEISPRLPAGTPPAEPSAGLAPQAESPWLMVLFAFLGGLILNLMPCVFPVLGIKVMSLVRQGQGDPGHARKHGHAYAMGVVACFWALAAALVVLRALGQSVGWGFQLQQPVFVTVLILLLSFVAADLAGFVRWSGRWMGMGSNLAGKEGSLGSFFTGVLAVVVATPCTAPFMGTAIGAAITKPGWVIFLVFTALALGLALPFVLLCYRPAFVKALPRPGAWMERLKEFFAIPMAATVLWLLWVLALQIGADGALKVELGLLVAVMGLWLRHSFAAKGAALGLALLLAGLAISMWGAVSSPVQGSSLQVGGQWKPYSEEALETALGAGKPVFVDFTAAWCLTCQVNKKLVLDRPAMMDYFAEKEVVLLLADWTNRDPVITAALERQGRIGVPLYLAYRRGQRTPAVLPQVLTDGILREALP